MSPLPICVLAYCCPVLPAHALRSCRPCLPCISCSRSWCLIRLCSQMLPPPHALHWLLIRLCSQMLYLPVPLLPAFTPLCGLPLAFPALKKNTIRLHVRIAHVGSRTGRAASPGHEPPRGHRLAARPQHSTSGVTWGRSALSCAFAVRMLIVPLPNIKPSAEGRAEHPRMT